MFLGDAAEKIQQFIDENPAAASFYGNSNKVSTNDIKEQIYSINDATKVKFSLNQLINRLRLSTTAQLFKLSLMLMGIITSN